MLNDLTWTDIAYKFVKLSHTRVNIQIVVQFLQKTTHVKARRKKVDIIVLFKKLRYLFLSVLRCTQKWTIF